MIIEDSILPADLKHWTKLSLARYGILPGHKMGQHFLVDNKVLQDIINTAEPSSKMPILEIGGGLGVLTLKLLARAERVVVVELDEKLYQGLSKLSLGNKNLKIIKGDILKISNLQLKQALNPPKDKWQIVANLPYEISGAFLQRFLWGDYLPQSMTLLLQREVAARIKAPPGKMSLLSLSCQLKSKVRIVRQIEPVSFWPPPRVQSSLVRLDLLSREETNELLAGQSSELLWRLARIGFAARRKVMINNLASALPISKLELEKIFKKIGLSPQARAQELSIYDWPKLTEHISQLISYR